MGATINIDVGYHHSLRSADRSSTSSIQIHHKTALNIRSFETYKASSDDSVHPVSLESNKPDSCSLGDKVKARRKHGQDAARFKTDDSGKMVIDKDEDEDMESDDEPNEEFSDSYRGYDLDCWDNYAARDRDVTLPAELTETLDGRIPMVEIVDTDTEV